MITKRKTVWWIEASIFILFLIQIAISYNTLILILPLLFAEVFVYGLLSLIFYYVYDDKVIFAEPKILVPYKKYDLSEDEKVIYYNRSFLYAGLLKLNIVIMLFMISLVEVLHLPEILVFLFLVLFISIMMVIILHFSKAILAAKGYKDITISIILKKYMIYYNPQDKRSVIDKPFGAGTTINFASKQGKLIAGILIGGPILILTILIIVFAISGKL